MSSSSSSSFQGRAHGSLRGVFAGSLGVLGALVVGAGCQPTDSTESDTDAPEVASPQALNRGDLQSAPTKGAEQAPFWSNPILAGKIGAPAEVVPTCVTITDGVAGGVTEDALLSGDYPASPSGQFFGAWTGVSSGGNNNYSAFKFHLDGIPTGNNVVVTSATMSVYVSWNSQNTTVNVHQALQPWDEASVTYASYPTSSWSPAAVGSFAAGGVGTRQVDVTPLVQAWLGGQAANNGVVLEEAPIASHYYFTREGGTPSTRPSLQVCYTVGNGPQPWTKVISGAGAQAVTSVAVGADNSVVAAGSFEQSVNLGGATFTAAGGSNMFLAKYDANGNHLWSRQFNTGFGNAWGTAVAADGSVYLVGDFGATIDLGGGTISSVSGTTDIFLAKYDANGNLLWAKRYGQSGSDSGRTVAVAPNGDIFIGGVVTLMNFQNPNQVNFGGPDANLGLDAPSSAFVVHLTANGDYVAQTFRNTTGQQTVYDIAVDSLGRPALAARMEEGVGFCANAAGAVSTPDLNEASLTANLGCRWGAMVGNQYSMDSPGAVAIGPQDSVVIGGYTGIIAPFGNVVDVTFAGMHLRKHDSAGALLWDNKFSLGGIEGVGVDAQGTVWATGTFSGGLNVTGGAPLAGNGGFVARFNGANGAGTYQTSFGSAVSPRDLALTPDSAAVIGGSFTGTANFGGGAVSANGGDAFIVKMVP